MSTQVELIERLLELTESHSMAMTAEMMFPMKDETAEIWKLLSPTIAMFDSQSPQSVEHIQARILRESLLNMSPSTYGARAHRKTDPKSIIQLLMPFAEEVDRKQG